MDGVTSGVPSAASPTNAGAPLAADPLADGDHGLSAGEIVVYSSMILIVAMVVALILSGTVTGAG